MRKRDSINTDKPDALCEGGWASDNIAADWVDHCDLVLLLLFERDRSVE